jgi:hypothetical protein
MLDLAISLRMGNYGPVHMDVMPVTEVQELFACELRAIIGDDDVGHHESMDYVGEE